MSDDLVRRLLSASIYKPHEAERLCEEAADRIEALEKALRLMLDNDRNLHKPLEELFAEFCVEARAALEEKDS